MIMMAHLPSAREVWLFGAMEKVTRKLDNEELGFMCVLWIEEESRERLKKCGGHTLSTRVFMEGEVQSWRQRWGTLNGRKQSVFN